MAKRGYAAHTARASGFPLPVPRRGNGTAAR